MDLSVLAQGFDPEPSFQVVRLKDVNPLGGTTKWRTIYQPNESMKKLHQRLIAALRKLDFALPHAIGARPGGSPQKNIRIHHKARHLYLLDIENAYLTVDGKKLATIIASIDPELNGRADEVYGFLCRYCLGENGGLLIGAPASPDLYNLYTGVLLDEPLAGLGRRYGLRYSRYLDDLIFSSAFPIGRRKRRAILAVIADAGFTTSPRKTRVIDLKKGPVVINGVGLAYGGRTFDPRHHTRKLRGLVHLSLRGRVDPAKIHGAMGVFVASTPRFMLGATDLNHGPNQTEKCLLRAYDQFKVATRTGLGERRHWRSWRRK